MISEEPDPMVPTWIDTNEYPFAPKEFSLPGGTISYLELIF